MIHKYRYEFRFPYPKAGIGAVFTGTLRTPRAFSDREVETLAREMANGVLKGATCTKVTLL